MRPWLTIGLSLCAASALAQEESTFEGARQHMERGRALYLEASFAESAAEFEAAYAAQPFSAFLYNAAVAFEQAGQPARAIELFEQYVAREAQAWDVGRVQRRVEALRAAQAGQPPSTERPGGVPDDFKSVLSVETRPEAATIIVRRGAEIVAQGPAPFTYTLDQGRYDVSVERPDHPALAHDVRVAPGRFYAVVVELSQGEFLGRLRVESDVPGAQVFIDDRDQGPRGQTPYEASVPIGTHRIWVERAGYEADELSAEVGVGETIVASAELGRATEGRLRVVGNIAHARVILDGRVIGEVPFEEEVAAGPHVLRVESAGMKAFEMNVLVERGQLTPVRVRLRPDMDRSGAIATGVFTGLLVVGGIVTAAIGFDLSSTLAAERDAGRLSSDDPRIDEGMILYIAADAAFGLGLIIGGLTLYYALWDPLPASEGQAREPRDFTFAPILDPVRGTAGLGMSGRF